MAEDVQLELFETTMDDYRCRLWKSAVKWRPRPRVVVVLIGKGEDRKESVIPEHDAIWCDECGLFVDEDHIELRPADKEDAEADTPEGRMKELGLTEEDLHETRVTWETVGPDR